MSPEELVHSAQLEEGLGALKAQVRDAPTDPHKRFFLFQLLSVMGQWEQAMTQLNIAADLDVNLGMFAHAGRRLLQAEALREEVFAGRRTPMILGEPDAWVSTMVQAARLLAHGHIDEALGERERALEAAPARPGRVDRQAFSWLCDADARMGPMLEGVVDGRYYWIPMTHIARVEIEAPSRLRDLVWLPTTFVWTNEGVSTGFLFTRYPGSHRAEDPAVRLARKTEWKDLAEGAQLGLGQRILISDTGDVPILEAREIEFEMQQGEA